MSMILLTLKTTHSVSKIELGGRLMGLAFFWGGGGWGVDMLGFFKCEYLMSQIQMCRATEAAVGPCLFLTHTR